VTIRHARPEDAAVIAALATQLGYPALPRKRKPACGTSSLKPAPRYLLALDEHSTVIGYGHVFGAHRVDSDPFAEIGALVVDETRRSRGTGAALVAAMEAWAIEHGYRELRVGATSCGSAPRLL